MGLELDRGRLVPAAPENTNSVQTEQKVRRLDKAIIER